MDDLEDEDFFYSNWKCIKNMKGRKTTLHGRTQRIIYDKHRKIINKLKSMEVGITAKNKIELKKLRDEISFINVVDDERPMLTLRTSSIYSLNKRKRWLLPQMFVEKARSYERFDDDFDYLLEIRTEDDLKMRHIRDYIDNKGLDLIDHPKINMPSLEIVRDYLGNGRFKTIKQLKRERRRNKRRINLAEYHMKKKPVKNGNRNRNSGIKREKETFLQDESPKEKFEAINIISAAFNKPKNLSEKKWPQVNYKHIENARLVPIKGWSYGPRFSKGYCCWGKHAKAMKRVLKLEGYKQRKLDGIEVKRDLVHYNKLLDDLDLAEFNISTCLNKEFEFSEFIISKTRIKSLKNIEKSVQFEDQLVNKKIIYINKEEVTNIDDTKIEVKESKPIDSINDLIELKAFVKETLRFYESFSELLHEKHVTIVYECERNLVLVKLKSRQYVNFSNYLVFDLNRVWTEKELNFRLNSYIDQSDIKEKLEAELSSEQFSSVYELLDFMTDQLDGFFKQPKVVRNEPKETYLIGVNSSRQFASIVDEYKADLARSKRPNRVLPKLSNRICPICFDECENSSSSSSTTSLLIRLNECGHRACRSCWCAYVQSRLGEFVTSRRPIECLFDKCETMLSEQLLLTLASVRAVDKYFTSLVEFKMLKGGGEYRPCPGVNCDRVIQMRPLSASIVRCSCGVALCRRCLAEAHFPVSCVQAKKYRDDLKMTTQVDDGKLYESEGKNCPFCNIYYEKSGGCTFMSCPCGGLFCWECLQNIIGHTQCIKKAPFVKYESDYFLQTEKRSYLTGKLGDIIAKERAVQARLNQWSWGIKCKEFAMKIENISYQELSNYFKIGYSYLKEISRLNEFFALLLKTTSNKSKFVKANVSYKPNLVNSLYKSLDLEQKLDRIIFEGYSIKDFYELIDLIRKLKIFTNNLVHILNYLGI